MDHRPVRKTTEMVVGALGRPHTHPLAQHHHGWSGTKDVPALNAKSQFWSNTTDDVKNQLPIGFGPGDFSRD